MIRRGKESLWAVCLLALFGSAVSAMAQHFSPQERAQVVAFWSEEGRYRVGAPPDAERSGPFVVRLSADGSQWLWDYNRARGLAKGPPTIDPGAQNPRERVWEAWIDAKVEWDRWHAASAADRANAQVGRPSRLAGDRPANPGPIPADLLELAGNPPPFAIVEAPLFHIVRFEDGTEIAYADRPAMRPRYAYYRFPEGVMSGGVPVRQEPRQALAELCREAGLSDSEIRIFEAVSLLEGGFDSVNTYDTGFVSVGLIQFASLREGGGSLGSVLADLKFTAPEAFDRYFRRYGIDVTIDGKLVAVDPGTGAEGIGAEANRYIIRDKRLIAVFQRAGRQSRDFRVAQLRVAKRQYYPADDVVNVVVGDRLWSGRIGDIVRSEAGLATLMDRKVNTGNLNPLPSVLAEIAQARRLRSFADFAAHEADIIARMRFRKNYLEDANLSRPNRR